MDSIPVQELGRGWERTSLHLRENDSPQLREAFEAVVEKLVSRYPFQIHLMRDGDKDVVIIYRNRVDGQTSVAAEYFDRIMREWALGARDRPERDDRVPAELRMQLMTEVLDPSRPMPDNACEVLFAALESRHVTEDGWRMHDARTVARWIGLPVRDNK